MIEVGLITDYLTSEIESDFIVTAVSTARWDWDKNLTTNFSDASLYDIPEHTNLNDFAWYGWNFYGSSTPDSPTIQYSDICYGLYKIYWEYLMNEGGGDTEYLACDSFYLDMRDDRYPDGPYPSNDFYIKLVQGSFEAEDQFSYMIISGSTFTTIQSGATVGVWTIQGVSGSPSLDAFQPTTPTGLTYTNVSGHPQLSWTLSEPQSEAEYQVWRKVYSTPPRYTTLVQNWSCLETVSAGTNTYTDNEFQITGTPNKVCYKILAVSGDGNKYSPAYSNTISIIGSFLPYDKQPSPTTQINLPSSYVSMYPNPFNNQIRINIEHNELITGVYIYDLCGKMVKRLSSNAGSFKVNTIWNGRTDRNTLLESGVYFLIVESGNKKIYKEKIIFLK